LKKGRIGHSVLEAAIQSVGVMQAFSLTVKGHTLKVFDCAFCPDGRLLATTSADMTTRIWDLATGQQVLKLAGYARNRAGERLTQR
jgi:WD40 repeat protein